MDTMRIENKITVYLTNTCLLFFLNLLNAALSVNGLTILCNQ